jgi:leucyl-tRNA synthetase
MWKRLGYTGSVAFAGWRKADRNLLVVSTVIAVVQVDGKVRDKLEVDARIGADELEALARETPGAKRSTAGRTIDKVIVRAPKIVSITTTSAP